MSGDDAQWFWVPDKQAVFVPATLKDGTGGGGGGPAKFSVNGNGKVVEAKIEDCHPIADMVLINDEIASTITDLSKMIDVFSGSILQVQKHKPQPIFDNQG